MAHAACGSVAARGRVCFLALRPEEDGGLAAATAAVAIAPRTPSVLLVPSGELERALSDGPVATGVLLCADSADDRLARYRAVQALREHRVPVCLLSRRLDWVTERRALFGSLSRPSRALPERLVERLLGGYAEQPVAEAAA